MKILLTAFDPFADEKINPTLEVLKKLEDNILDSKIIKLALPTVFDKSSKILEEKNQRNKTGCYFISRSSWWKINNYSRKNCNKCRRCQYKR